MRSTAWGAAASLALVATATPALAQDDTSSVSVLHAVPGLSVDVYVNGEDTLPGFEPGTLTDPLELAAGSYDIEVYAAGADPAAEDPAISGEGLEVPGGANLTLTRQPGRGRQTCSQRLRQRHFDARRRAGPADGAAHRGRSGRGRARRWDSGHRGHDQPQRAGAQPRRRDGQRRCDLSREAA
ncbi:MAG: DUF4397 domain-containing protein [Ornithinimicrobium sp.]|uniref:DUF4397 domain-containing protein n=1 Tax=Ornithinimicrobium sp. TaxID=1977084 RepID=UPI003D9AE6F5